jgi:hypothetical protein
LESVMRTNLKPSLRHGALPKLPPRFIPWFSHGPGLFNLFANLRFDGKTTFARSDLGISQCLTPGTMTAALAIGQVAIRAALFLLGPLLSAVWTATTTGANRLLGIENHSTITLKECHGGSGSSNHFLGPANDATLFNLDQSVVPGQF